ncbi:glycolate oxidase subunit GlcF [Rhodobacteraceae bacterium]|nr:glycolate oxidase subunit GlcF [Paracoccaceae bacterium]
MKTDFTPEQLRDPAIRRSNDILRACVHCGFCTATCPSYQVLGDELDSPRGRIYLIKDMLENDRPADAETVKHIDRCLGCLACMTTCPSGVDYAHLLDHARQHIETTYKRPWHDRALRWILAHVLPYPARLRHALRAAKMVRPLGRYLPDPRARAMLAMVPDHIAGPAPHDAPQIHRAARPARARVALMTGCAQKTLNPEINAATIRLLTRLGVDVVVAKGTGCCGALVHHMGRTHQSHDFARQNIRAWGAEIDGQGLDAIVINTSGCGTTVKDYGDMLGDTEMAGQARAVSDRAMDICEFLARLDLAPVAAPQDLRVTYHAACSLQHGQKITQAPKRLLTQAGFTLATPADAHLCCGSAGTYNLLQPAIADQLKVRKLDTLRATRPDVIAAGNIGCMTQIGADAGVPVVHTVQLLDWAYGGPRPAALGAGPLQKPH